MIRERTLSLWASKIIVSLAVDASFNCMCSCQARDSISCTAAQLYFDHWYDGVIVCCVMQVETLIPMLLQDQDAVEGGAGRLKRVVSQAHTYQHEFTLSLNKYQQVTGTITSHP